MLTELLERDGGVRLIFEGREVSFPAHARDEVAVIAAADGTFTVMTSRGRWTTKAASSSRAGSSAKACLISEA